MIEIVWLIVAYLFGSINNGILFSIIIHKSDIRKFGSKNAGSTNILRTFGAKSAAIVFVLDILKPILPVLCCRLLTPTAFASFFGGQTWISLLAILGQCYPLYFGFKGGKGAASTLGMMLIFYPLSTILGTLTFIITLLTTKYVSLSTLVGVSLTAIVNLYFYPQLALPYFIVVFILFWRHKANIKRLLSHTETKISIKK